MKHRRAAITNTEVTVPVCMITTMRQSQRWMIASVVITTDFWSICLPWYPLTGIPSFSGAFQLQIKNRYRYLERNFRLTRSQTSVTVIRRSVTNDEINHIATIVSTPNLAQSTMLGSKKPAMQVPNVDTIENLDDISVWLYRPQLGGPYDNS